MERFEEIRREHAHGAGTIRAVAKKLGVHRRMVRQALRCTGTLPDHMAKSHSRPSEARTSALDFGARGREISHSSTSRAVRP